MWNETQKQTHKMIYTSQSLTIQQWMFLVLATFLCKQHFSKQAGGDALLRLHLHEFNAARRQLIIHHKCHAIENY